MIVLICHKNTFMDYASLLTSSLGSTRLMRPAVTKEKLKTKDLFFNAQIIGLIEPIQIWAKLYPFVTNHSQVCTLISCYKLHSEKLTINRQMM